MGDRKLVIALLSDGQYVAASTGAPYFCTVGDSAEAVAQRAEEAASFYLGVTKEPAQARAPHVSHVERVVPFKVDAWLADAAMNAA